MLLPIFILYLSHLVLAIPVQPEYDLEDIEQLQYHFNDFKVKHNKMYTLEEERLRFHYFKENLAKINELNRQSPLTVYGINKFTDFSAKEMQAFYGLGGANLGGDYGACDIGYIASDINNTTIKDAVDWRDKNAVAPVQDQGVCGSCWAFSTASVLEGAYALKHNNLLKVSEQQFVDCDTQSTGCDGGWMHYAVTSNMQQGGQELEQDYPYQGVQQQCQFDVSKAQVKATACTVYPDIGDNDKLANLLAMSGPLSIALDASAFQSYNNGIITQCSAQAMNHAVSLIGYGEEGGTQYWIIKNSWGTGWGESGFVRVKKGVGCLMIGGYALSAEVA